MAVSCLLPLTVSRNTSLLSFSCFLSLSFSLVFICVFMGATVAPYNSLLRHDTYHFRVHFTLTILTLRCTGNSGSDIDNIHAAHLPVTNLLFVKESVFPLFWLDSLAVREGSFCRHYVAPQASFACCSRCFTGSPATQLGEGEFVQRTTYCKWTFSLCCKVVHFVTLVSHFKGCMYDLAREKPALFIKKCQEKVYSLQKASFSPLKAWRYFYVGSRWKKFNIYYESCFIWYILLLQRNRCWLLTRYTALS